MTEKSGHHFVTKLEFLVAKEKILAALATVSISISSLAMLVLIKLITVEPLGTDTSL